MLFLCPACAHSSHPALPALRLCCSRGGTTLSRWATCSCTSCAARCPGRASKRPPRSRSACRCGGLGEEGPRALGQLVCLLRAPWRQRSFAPVAQSHAAAKERSPPLHQQQHGGRASGCSIGPTMSRCCCASHHPAALPHVLHCLPHVLHCRYEKISEKKMATPTEYLCKGFPTEFVVFFQYVRSLRFDDKPDYAYLRKLFRDLFVREGERAAAQCGAPAPPAAYQLPQSQAGRGCRSPCIGLCFALPTSRSPRSSGGTGRRHWEGVQWCAHCILLLEAVFSSLPSPALLLLPAGFTWDYVFDWTILKYAQQQQNSRPSTSRPADGAYAAQPGRAQEERDAEAALRKLGLQ